MINKKYGNILNVKKGYIVHGCNAQGVMGSGLALQVKNQYPKVYKKYIEEYNENSLAVGGIIPVYVSDDLCIINAITQKYYGRDKDVVYVSYPGIISCMTKINRLVQTGSLVKELHFPLIGCGLANGDWKTIECIIDNNIPDIVTKVLWKR